MMRSVRWGTVVNVTPRVTEDNRISLELDLQDTRLYTPADADEVGIGPDGLMIPQETTFSRLTRNLTVAIGEATIVEGMENETGKTRAALRVVVIAQFGEAVAP
jgi:hypothetical protein